jgi:hypothetical protein
MTVRMKVARSAGTSSTPTFAKIAVSAAKIAESTAQNCHDEANAEFIGITLPFEQKGSFVLQSGTLLD